MKKLVYLSAAALALTACVMETEQIPATGNVETITFEAEASTQTKTTLVDGTKVYWCAGDQISVSGAAAPFTNALAKGETAAKTAFTGDVATADKYYAVYPASAVQSWNGAVATVAATMRQQITAEGTFVNGVNITAANTTSQDKSFSFKNVMGYVKVVLPEDIKTVIVTANGGETLHSKGLLIDCASEVPSVTVSTSADAANCVTLFDYTEIPAGEYYIALIPGTYSEGLTFDFVGTDNKVATISINESVELKAGHINSIGTVSALTWNDPAEGLENVIWKGKYVTGKWDNGMADLAEGRYDWSKAKAGDMLRVHGGATDPNKAPTMAFKNKSWSALAGLKDYYNDPSAEMSVTLSEEAVAELKDGGLIIQGDAYYFTAIELVPGTGAEDPGEDTGATVLWEGEFEFVSWNGWQELAWGAYDWSKCKPGNVLRISGNPTNPSADWWVLSLKVGGLNGWDSLAGVPSQYGKPGILYIELTQEIIDDLVARNGLVIQGDGYIMTKIELYEEMPSEVVVWEGAYDLGTSYSGGLSVAIGEVPYGATLNIGYETPAGVGDGYYQIKLISVGSDWGWNAMNSTDAEVNEYGYVTLNASATEYSVKLTDSDVDAINAGQKAIVVQGYAATITKVSYTVE